MRKKSVSYDKNTRYSSAWLGADLSKKLDVIELAAYKKAISNFVNIITKRNDIPVQFQIGSNSYTDGKSVVIGSDLKDRAFDVTVGLALHEGSHIAYTDFKCLTQAEEMSKQLVSKYPLAVTSKNECFYFIKTLLNIIEDRRIDQLVYTIAPGYQGYYQSMYLKYFHNDIIDKALIKNVKTSVTWEDYIFHICNFTNKHRNLNALPNLNLIWNVIDLANISRLSNTTDALNVAMSVFDIIAMEIQKDLESKQPATKDNAPEEVEASSKSNPSSHKENNDSEKDYLEEDSQEEETQEEETQEEETQDNSGASDSKSKDSSESDDTSDSNAAAEMESEETESEEIETDPFSEEELEKLSAAIEVQSNFLEGRITKKSVTSKVARQIQIAIETNAEYVRVNDGQTKCAVVYGISESIISSDILQNVVLKSSPRWDSGYSVEAVNDGIRLGIALGKKLKTRDEERTLSTTRLASGRIDKRLIAELGFANDRIFSQTIHSTTTPSCVHISLDASGSMTGTKWHSALKTAVAIAKAASMTTSIDCIITLRGNTPDGNPLMWFAYDSKINTINDIKKYFKTLYPYSSTPEGLCFEGGMTQILKSMQSKHGIFVNVSDGEPSFSRYFGIQAANHTRDQINKIKRANVQVCSYFVSHDASYNVSESYEAQLFRRMYGADAEFIDTNNLQALARTLNNKLIRNNE